MNWYKCIGGNGGGSSGGGVEYLINPNTLVSDTYIDISTGAEVAYSTWSSTPFIKVTAGETLKVAGANTSHYNAYYDDTKTFISSFIFPANVGYSEFTVPSGVSYIRLSDSTSVMNSTMLWRDTGGSGNPYERLCYVEYVMNDTPEKPTISTLDSG